MLADLTSRFAAVQTSKHYYIATMLDPRFKDRFLDPITVELATDHLEEVNASIREEPVAVSSPHQSPDSSPTAVSKCYVIL